MIRFFQNNSLKDLFSTVTAKMILACTIIYILTRVKVIAAFMMLYPFKVADFNPIQLITYQFVHGNFEHLFWNMITFYFGSSLLEQRLKNNGNFNSIGYFSLLVVAGTIIPLIECNVFLPIPTCGLSGVIMFCFGILFFLEATTKAYLFGVIPISIRTFCIISVAMDVYGFLEQVFNYKHLLSDNSGMVTGHLTHICGFILGLVAYHILPIHKPTKLSAKF